MTSIERTAYPRFTRAPSVKELREIYTPTPTDVAFVATTARGPAQKFGLMILLKVYQRLGYFPKPETIPGAIIGHLRAVMKLPADLVPDIASNHTLYRYYGVPTFFPPKIPAKDSSGRFSLILSPLSLEKMSVLSHPRLFH
jgi:hypothetical protein